MEGHFEENIKENIEKIRSIICTSAEKTGRKSEDITFVAVTKTIDCDRINEAIAHGVTDIGENRVQELLSKYEYIMHKETVRFHLIGRLQTNKVKYIIDKVYLIHSVDSERLLMEINKQSEKINKITNVLLEVNCSGEEQKAGFFEEELDAVLGKCRGFSHIKVCGLMTLPSLNDSLSKNSQCFRKLRQLFIDIAAKKYDNVSMNFLSMGMSNDFDIAIEEGSNLVRIGSAIFGKRNTIIK